MRKKSTTKIGETKEFTEAMKDLSTRKHLLLESRYALQKVLDMERENRILGPRIQGDLEDYYRGLGKVVDSLERTETRAGKIAERAESDLADIALEVIAEALGFSEEELEALKKF